MDPTTLEYLKQGGLLALAGCLLYALSTVWGRYQVELAESRIKYIELLKMVLASQGLTVETLKALQETMDIHEQLRVMQLELRDSKKETGDDTRLPSDR